MTTTRAAETWTTMLVSRTQARAAGRTDEEIRALLTSGRWTALRRGCYAPTDALLALSPAHRTCLDALALYQHLDRPSAVFSHATAARFAGLMVPHDADPLLRLTDPSRWRSGTGYRMTRAALPVAELARRGPFPVTDIARTLVDCCAEWSLRDGVAATDAALLSTTVTRAQVEAVLARAPSRAGMPAVRRVLNRADGRSESWLESAWRVAHVDEGLPAPMLQVEIWIDGTLVKVVDGWFPGQAIAVECDGRIKYDDPYRGRTPAQVLWDEKHKEDALRAVGIRVIRVVTADLPGPYGHSRWAALVARTRRELAATVPVLGTFHAVPREQGRVRPATDSQRVSRLAGG